MPKPTLPEILAEFEAEIARAPRFASVDRDLLQRLIDDHRRLRDREARRNGLRSARAALNGRRERGNMDEATAETTVHVDGSP